jgi:chromosome segregation ATPase
MSEEAETKVLTSPPRGDTRPRLKSWKRTYSNNPEEKQETEPKSPTQHSNKISIDSIKDDIDVDKLSNNTIELKGIAKAVLYSRNAAVSDLENKTKVQKSEIANLRKRSNDLDSFSLKNLAKIHAFQENKNLRDQRIASYLKADLSNPEENFHRMLSIVSEAFKKEKQLLTEKEIATNQLRDITQKTGDIESDRKIRQIQEQIQDWEKKNESASQTLRAKESQENNLKEQNSKILKTIMELKQEFEKVNAEEKNHHTERSRIESEYSTLENTITSNESKLLENEQEIKLCDEEHQSLQQEIEARLHKKVIQTTALVGSSLLLAYVGSRVIFSRNK